MATLRYSSIQVHVETARALQALGRMGDGWPFHMARITRFLEAHRDEFLSFESEPFEGVAYPTHPEKTGSTRRAPRRK